jgi:hypothetical protein
VNKFPAVEWPPLQAAVEDFLFDYLSQHATHSAG